MTRQLLTLLLSSVAISALTAEEAVVTISYREQITNFWGEREVKLHLVVAANEDFAGEMNWSLRAAGRTLISRTAEIEVAAGAKAEVEVRYTLPAVKDGLIYPIELYAFAGPKGKPPEAELREMFYLFGPNPFTESQEWLKSLKIKLFDPEDNTAETLEKHEIPFERITNPATIEELRDGVLIIGEDVPWDDYGELGPTLLSAAARGVNVLCLAGANAELPLPSARGGATARAQQLSFRQTDVLRELDKRFSLQWTGEQTVVSRSLSLIAEQDVVLARTDTPEAGWPWMEIRFPQKSGKTSTLVWCGLRLIRSWDDTPTPRYVLLKWLEKEWEQGSGDH